MKNNHNENYNDNIKVKIIILIMIECKGRRKKVVVLGGPHLKVDNLKIFQLSLKLLSVCAESQLNSLSLIPPR